MPRNPASGPRRRSFEESRLSRRKQIRVIGPGVTLRGNWNWVGSSVTLSRAKEFASEVRTGAKVPHKNVVIRRTVRSDSPVLTAMVGRLTTATTGPTMKTTVFQVFLRERERR